MHLLDTDVVVDVLRGYPQALDWLDSLESREQLLLPGYVVMEVMHGCRNRQEQKRVERFVERFRILWASGETCDRAPALFARAHLATSIGILDAFIGQMAVDLDVPLCTFNAKHDQAIVGLWMVQPYEKAP